MFLIFLVSPRDKTRKKSVPISFVLPELNECSNNIEKLKEILNALQIIYKVVTKRKSELILDVTAVSNTWSNQRRKRRILKRLSGDQVKKAKPDSEITFSQSPEKEQGSSSELNESILNKSTETEQESTSNHGTHDNSLQNKSDPIVHAIMKIINKGATLNVQFEFLNGTAGKEGLHQIVQYIKNNWK